MVIAIIAILAAMLLPALAGAKEKGKQAYCINSLKQLNIIFHMYEDENEGWLHHTPGGSPPNHGKWYMNPRMKAARKLIGSSATQWANPNSGDAYWDWPTTNMPAETLGFGVVLLPRHLTNGGRTG